ncbi:MAG: hypothetical protein R3B96_17055 [Pirellulaceae bacterium]
MCQRDLAIAAALLGTRLETIRNDLALERLRQIGANIVVTRSGGMVNGGRPFVGWGEEPVLLAEEAELVDVIDWVAIAPDNPFADAPPAEDPPREDWIVERNGLMLDRLEQVEVMELESVLDMLDEVQPPRDDAGPDDLRGLPLEEPLKPAVEPEGGQVPRADALPRNVVPAEPFREEFQEPILVEPPGFGGIEAPGVVIGPIVLDEPMVVPPQIQIWNPPIPGPPADAAIGQVPAAIDDLDLGFGPGQPIDELPIEVQPAIDLPVQQMEIVVRGGFAPMRVRPAQGAAPYGGEAQAPTQVESGKEIVVKPYPWIGGTTNSAIDRWLGIPQKPPAAIRPSPYGYGEAPMVMGGRQVIIINNGIVQVMGQETQSEPREDRRSAFGPFDESVKTADPYSSPASFNSRMITIDESWRGTDEDWALLAHVEQLENLQINGIELTESVLNAIKSCPRLTHLSINRCRGDYAALMRVLDGKQGLTVAATGLGRMGIYGGDQLDFDGCLVGR